MPGRWIKNPFKPDRIETKSIPQARIDIHEHKHASFIKNGRLKHPPHLHLPLARIQWVLRLLEGREAMVLD